MRGITDRIPIVSTQLHPKIDLIISTIHNVTPKIGNRMLFPMKCKNANVMVLFDTGSPSSFIRKDVAHKLRCQIQQTPDISFMGAVSSLSSSTNQGASIILKNGNISFNVDVYIIDSIKEGIIIGNPIIREQTELMEFILDNNGSKPQWSGGDNEEVVSRLSAGKDVNTCGISPIIANTQGLENK